MKPGKPTVLTTRARICSPHAVPISTLLQKGDAVSRRFQGHFAQYLKLRVDVLDAMLVELNAASPISLWREFFTAVHDIRGSAALANEPTVVDCCVSLENLLQERDPDDPRMSDAIAAHIDALHFIVSGGTDDESSKYLLIAQLSRAVEALPEVSRDLRCDR